MKMKKCIAGIMATLTAFSVFMFGGCDNGTDKGADKGNNPPNVENNVQTDITITENESNGLTLCTAPILESDYAAYGVSEQAESAVTITATVSPSNATNVNLDWSVSFVNPDSEWATGKTVTDYVTITEQSETTAVLTNLKPFGEQIQMTVCVADNTAVNAVATCDYVKKILAGDLHIYFANSLQSFVPKEQAYFSNGLGVSDINNVSFMNASYSAYTVDDNFNVSLSVSINKVLFDALCDIGDIELSPSGYDTFLPVRYGSNYIAHFLLSATVFEKQEKVNLFIEAMQEIGANVEIGTIRITATGEYSIKTFDYPLYLGTDCLTIPVESVTLDNVNVQF